MLAIERDRALRDEAKRTADKYITRDGRPVYAALKRADVRFDRFEAALKADEYMPARKRSRRGAKVDDDDMPF